MADASGRLPLRKESMTTTPPGSASGIAAARRLFLGRLIA